MKEIKQSAVIEQESLFCTVGKDSEDEVLRWNLNNREIDM